MCYFMAQLPNEGHWVIEGLWLSMAILVVAPFIYSRVVAAASRLSKNPMPRGSYVTSGRTER